MARYLFEKFTGADLTDLMLNDASKLFNENYGVWGKRPAESRAKSPRPGTPVKLSRNRIRKELLPEPALCSYIRVIVDDRLAGNVFACRWRYHDKTICWVTQLVVHREFRERGLALGMVNLLREGTDDLYGILSSHPAACLASAKAFGDGISAPQLDVIRRYAKAITEISPIEYIRTAELRGSAFDSQDTGGLVSCADTNFYVDHAEPLEVLAWVRSEISWPLGDLHDGLEFLLVVETKRHSRKKSRPTLRTSVSTAY